ncbi:MAG TPA: MMPL family transporter, partial [Myxococcota bacterium]|nr:MMPL family transporter [Myxococcota bacterium]
MLQNWIASLAERTARRPWATLAACLVLTALSVWALFQLPMYTSRKALFRADQPMVQRLDRFMEDFGAASDLIVAIEGAPRPDLERFALELAKDLSGQPGIRAADPRIDLSFFLDHAYAMVPPKDLDAAESYVRQVLTMPDGPPPTIDEALDAASDWFEDPPSLTGKTQELSAAQAALEGVLFFLREWQRWLESPQPPDAVAWDGLLENQPDTRDLVAGNGFYGTRDGTMLFLFVSPASPSEDIDNIGPFIRTVRATTEALRDRWRAAGLTVPTYGLTGNPAVVYEEFTSVQQGTMFTVASAAVLVLLLIVFVLRSLRRALVVFVPMGLGAVWGMALLYLTVGHLTMITMAFTAILFGLGVDYGIFVSSRILEELKDGGDLLPAIARGTGAAALPVVTAGGATTLVFLALATVQFKGFSELGIVAACGVVAVQLSTFAALPALFALLRPRNKPGLLTNHDGASAAGGNGTQMPKPVAAAVVALAVVIAAIGTSAGIKLPVNYDV